MQRSRNMYQFIGYLEPGHNIISIAPVERTREPPRETGIVMCKDCGLEEMMPIGSAVSTNELN
jgi:hypothetical protein